MATEATGNVLVLGKGVRAFLSVIRSLGRAGLSVEVGMCGPDDLALRSRYVRRYHAIVPYEGDGAAWLEAMRGVLTEKRFDLVIPCTDPALIPVQIHREDLCRLAGVYCLGEKAYRIAFDKIASTRLAASLGICVPAEKVVPADMPAGEVLAGLSLPVVLKPPSSFSAADLSAKRRVYRAGTVSELAELLERCRPWGQVQVQENFIGRGVGVNVLAWSGRVLTAFQHIRVHEPLAGGGSSYRASQPIDPRLLRAAERLMAALDYTGVAMVEFKVDPSSGRWVFIEINGRFWGSLALALASGVDFPLYLYQMLVEGRRTFPRTYAPGVHCRNLLPDLRWQMANLVADRSDPVLQTRPLRRVALEPLNILLGREHLDTLTVDDPAPGVAEIAEVLRTALKKLASVLGARWRRLRPVRWVTAARARAIARRAESVLFVCKGNICRSPFAEAYARRKMPDLLTVSSAGYYPVVGRRSPEAAQAAAAEWGVDLRGHRSRLLNGEMVRQAGAIFVFDRENRRRVLRDFPHARGKLHLVGSLGAEAEETIQDPYGADVETFRAAYRRISAALDRMKACRAPKGRRSG